MKTVQLRTGRRITSRFAARGWLVAEPRRSPSFPGIGWGFASSAASHPRFIAEVIFRPVLFCFWFLFALGLELIVSRADAAGPSVLNYLQACGIGTDAFAKFADDRQIAEEELDVIRRIAIRLRDCPADRLQHTAQQDASFQRGRMYELQGSIASVEPVEDQGDGPLWRCTMTLSESSQRAMVYVAAMPERLRHPEYRVPGSNGQRVAVDGVFVKYVPGTAAAEPTAVIVAPRLQWRAESPLGSLGMDLGLLEGIHDNSPLTAVDHDAFYRLLQLARSADPDRLRRDAERLDFSSPGLPALFRDPSSQRGRLLRLSGTARRVVRIPIDDPAVVSRLARTTTSRSTSWPRGRRTIPSCFARWTCPTACR